MESKSSRISLGEKVGYGCGDLASNFVFHIVNAFLLFYYTNVYGIAPAAAGTLFLVAKLWDAVTDPLMGTLADRTHTRFGKYRPFLLWMAIPYGIIGFLAFLGPDLDDGGKLVFAYVTYIALMTIYTAINVPYSALMGVITPDPDERASLSTFRFWGAFSAQLVIGLALFPMLAAFGGREHVTSWRGAMVVFSILAIILFLTTFFTTRERVPPQKDQSQNLGMNLGLLARNRPLVIMLVVAVLTLGYSGIRWAITHHYLSQVANLSGEKIILVWGKFDLFYTGGPLAFILGLFMTKKVIALFGKRNALLGLTVLNGVAMIAFYFLPPENYAAIFWLNVVAAFIAGPTPAIVWAMYTDVADYGEWKFGKRITGLTFASAMFFQKVGLGIGGALAGWLLGYYGFVKDTELTAQTKEGITLMFSVFPGVCAILTACVLLFYKLTDNDVKKISLELEERRKKDQAIA
ncbi:MAG: MFS transporter [Roseibacillus sp.]